MFVRYEITMANSKDVPFEEKLAAVKNAISVFTKLHEAKEFKEEGSKFFKDGHYVKAIFTYRKIFDILDFQSIKPYVLADDKQAESKALVIAGGLNISLCWMKLKQWKRAKAMCSRILEMDRDVVKAWYRRGKYLST